MKLDHEKYHLLGVGLPTLVNHADYYAIAEGEYILAYLHDGPLRSVLTTRIGNLGTRGTRRWYGITAVSAGALQTVGLRRDETVKAIGFNEYCRGDGSYDIIVFTIPIDFL